MRALRGPSSGRAIDRAGVPVKAFWSRVDRRSAGECWLYLGPKDRGGYGSFNLGRSPYRAHRIAFAIRYGSVTSGAVVMHTCDNPPCCNPRHLKLATQRANLLDARQKGRWKPMAPRLVVGSVCEHGHAITAESLYVAPCGQRSCRGCIATYRERVLAKYRRHTAARIRGMLTGQMPTTWEVLAAAVGERRADAFASAYGLFGRPLESLTMIGHRFGLTRERIRQYVVETENRLGLVRTVKRRAGLHAVAA